MFESGVAKLHTQIARGLIKLYSVYYETGMKRAGLRMTFRLTTKLLVIDKNTFVCLEAFN